jgi:hypothetical protein
MKRILIAAVSAFILVGCTDLKDKSHPLGSAKIADGLYEEWYQVDVGNATTTSTDASYLTDSVSFRKFIAIYDTGYGPKYIVKGDTIWVYLYRDGYPFKDKIVTKRFKLSLRELKEEGAWE